MVQNLFWREFKNVNKPEKTRKRVFVRARRSFRRVPSFFPVPPRVRGAARAGEVRFRAARLGARPGGGRRRARRRPAGNRTGRRAQGGEVRVVRANILFDGERPRKHVGANLAR